MPPLTAPATPGSTSVRPLQLKKSADIAKAIHEIMATDFLYPQQAITDGGSEFTSKEAQAAFAQFGILVEYIPTAEHHLNLVEQAHRSLWDIIRAIKNGQQIPEL